MNNETKIKALLHQIESGQMENDASKILNFIIQKRKADMPLICKELKMSEKVVSARLSGLQDIGIIQEVKQEEAPRYKTYRYQKSPAMQVHNAYMREKWKFEQWKKSGIRRFSKFLKLDQYRLDL